MVQVSNLTWISTLTNYWTKSSQTKALFYLKTEITTSQYFKFWNSLLILVFIPSNCIKVFVMMDKCWQPLVVSYSFSMLWSIGPTLVNSVKCNNKKIVGPFVFAHSVSKYTTFFLFSYLFISLQVHNS